MKRLTFVLALLCLSFISLNAQNVTINDDNSTGDANAILDVKSTTKGVLFPRLTTAQRTTLGNLTPTEGMLVFDTETDSYWFFANGTWVELAAANSEVPVGTILPFGGTTIPSGFLECDGSAVSSTTYPGLFTALGTTWGGDGSPNFNLPDLQGRFLRGKDNGAGTDPDAASRTALYSGGNTGDNVGTYQEDEFEAHQHILPEGRNGVVGSPYGSVYAGTRNSYSHSTNSTSEHPLVAAAGGSTETRPENASVLYIIKY